MWKERLWQVFLVAILGLSLTMCSKSGDNTPVANAGLSEISHTMFCAKSIRQGSIRRYYNCDASDDTELVTDSNSYNYSITHDAAFAAGWKLVGPGCGTGDSYITCFLFHK